MLGLKNKLCSTLSESENNMRKYLRRTAAAEKPKDDAFSNDEHEHAEPSQVIAVDKNIYLFGGIDPVSTGWFIKAFQDADAKQGIITVQICSMGGWLEGGMAMADVIRTARNKVATIGMGAVYSAAVLPFMAGDYRLLSPMGRIMVHEPAVHMGDSRLKDILRAGTEMDRVYEDYCKFVAERSGLRYDFVESMCHAETYLDTKEALKLNFAHDIIKVNNNKYDGNINVPKKSKGKKK